MALCRHMLQSAEVGSVGTLRTSGDYCVSWYSLDWHWQYPESDLERDGCRSLAAAS